MLSGYANQSLSWGSRGTPNEYNESTFSTVTIKGRMETGYKRILNSQGVEVVSSARVMTESHILVGDKIDGSTVIAVNTMFGMEGTVEFYECYLQ